jgi:hypothetical protein
VNPAFTPGEEAFRAEVRAFLADHPGVDSYFDSWRADAKPADELYRAMGERGWLSLAWPPDAGGMGKPPTYEFILWDEMAHARAARPPLGAGIVAKTIIAHGTEDQKRRFLPAIRSGEIRLSLGYSEPEAGSDLGNIRTRAVREGDVYVVTGEKRWTSGAHQSDYLWLLCRTGSLESRSRGLTFLVLDLHADGVSISPIPAIDGTRFNEVRLEGVRVPVENRVGPEGDAWQLAVESLAIERIVQFPPGRVVRDYEDLVAWVRENGLTADPIVAHRLADLAVEVDEARALALVALDAVCKGSAAVVEAACNKLASTEVCQHIGRAAADVGAPEALVRGTAVEFLWRQSLSETIGGGTNEVMRGVIARNALGLAARL